MTQSWKRVGMNLLTVGGLVAALGFAGTALTTAACTGFYQAATPWARAAREQVRGEHLEAQLRETARRIAARDQVVAALRAGRLTLREAAARFRALDADCPDPRRDILTLVTRKSDPAGRGLSYDECVCRNVIEYARRSQDIHDSDNSHRDVADIAPRLEEEFRQLARAGALHLPE